MPTRVFDAAAGYRLSLAIVAVIAVGASLIGGTPSPASPAATITLPWLDTSDREAVLVAWQAERLREVPPLDWTGAHEGCRPGTSSLDLAQRTVERVNFYRALAGVPANVVLNEDYSAKAHHGALAMSATGKLSHDPDDSFECLDDVAREAAANSNLYLGRTGPSAIDGYIEDPGDRNVDVGHRNTILHPPTKEIGVAHVAGTAEHHAANLLWVFDDDVFSPNPALREPDGFVAWPPRGYVPSELIHPRWSFGMDGADFSVAEVSLMLDGRSVPIEVVTRHSLPDYVPLPILVWEPVEPLQLQSDDVDRSFSVTIRQVLIDGERHDFSYDVVAIDSTPEIGRQSEPLDLLQRVLRRPLAN